MNPFSVATADSRLKSPDAVTPLQCLLVPASPPSGNQFAPASTDIYNAPPVRVTIIFVKSDDAARSSQFAVAEFSDVQDVPLLEVY